MGSSPYPDAVSDACKRLLTAANGSALSKDTCSSCFDDGCCLKKSSLFGASMLSCSDSPSPLARCVPRNSFCQIELWRLWAAIFVPIGISILACVAGCIYCCIKRPKFLVMRGYKRFEDNQPVGEQQPTATAGSGEDRWTL